MAGLDDKRSLLERVSIFADLEAREVEALLRTTVTKKLGRGELLFRKGDEGSSAYIIASGKLKVITAGDDGREFVFQILEPGEVLGEIALLDRSPRSATVEAMEPSELLVIQRRELLPFLRSHPEAAIKMLGHVAGLVRGLSDQLQDTVFLGLPNRLAKKLLGLAASFGRPDPAGTLIDLKLSQQELGELLGTSRESINKQMRKWVDEGVLSVEKGYIRLLDEDALGELARYSLA